MIDSEKALAEFNALYPEEVQARAELANVHGIKLRAWLREFGYMHGANNDERVAFRRARAERGPVRLAAELANYVRPSCRT